MSQGNGLSDALVAKIQNGQGLSPIETDAVNQWWEQTFLPELARINQLTQTSTNTSTGTADFFGGLFSQSFSNNPAQNYAPTFTPPDLTPFTNAIGGIEQRLSDISGFTTPANFESFAGRAEEIDPILENIGDFRPPNLNPLLYQARNIRDALSAAKGSFGGPGGLTSLAAEFEVPEIPSYTVDDLLPSGPELMAALQGRRPTGFGASELLPEEQSLQSFLDQMRPTGFGAEDFMPNAQALQRLLADRAPDRFSAGAFIPTAGSLERELGLRAPDALGVDSLLPSSTDLQRSLDTRRPSGFSASSLLPNEQALARTLAGMAPDALTASSLLPGADALLRKLQERRPDAFGVEQFLRPGLERDLSSRLDTMKPDAFKASQFLEPGLEGALSDRLLSMRPDAFGAEQFIRPGLGADLTELLGNIKPGAFGAEDFLPTAAALLETLQSRRPDAFGAEQFIRPGLGADLTSRLRDITPSAFDATDFMPSRDALMEVLSRRAPDRMLASGLLPTAGALEEEFGKLRPGALSATDLLPSGLEMEGLFRSTRPSALGAEDLLPSAGSLQGLLDDRRPGFTGEQLLPSKQALQQYMDVFRAPGLGLAPDQLLPGSGALQSFLESIAPGLEPGTVLPGAPALQQTLEGRAPSLTAGDVLPGASDLQTLLSGRAPSLTAADVLPGAPELQDFLSGTAPSLSAGDVLPGSGDLRDLLFDRLPSESAISSLISDRFPSADPFLEPFHTGIDELVQRLLDLNAPIGGEGITVNTPGLTAEDRNFLTSIQPEIPTPETLDLDPVFQAIDALSNQLSAGAGTGGGPTVDTGDGEVPITSTDAGSFLNTLRGSIESGLGKEVTAESLRQDPLTASLLADYEESQRKIRNQRLEDLKRQGVLRDGDRIRAEETLLEGFGRGESRILADSAQRALDERQTAQQTGVNVGDLFAKRELGLGELTGRVGGEATLAGRQADLDLIGASIAALEAGGESGRFDPLATALLGGLNFLPEKVSRDLGGGLTAETRLRDLIAGSVAGGVSNTQQVIDFINKLPSGGGLTEIEWKALQEVTDKASSDFNPGDFTEVTGTPEGNSLTSDQVRQILATLSSLGITSGSLVDSLNFLMRSA